ncbi:MAG: hypothetical protein GY820_21795, partial [Gammaproteobacteria bacterium]|nr:hypothetical protein [Gammaproteobacteria bacterium]
KDVRQAEGYNIFTQSASKYADNLIELFVDDLDAITGEELRVATREGPLQDANPMSRIAGLTIKPPQNATELAYGMSEMMTYTANMRTKNPAYDRAYNGLVAPLLERSAERMLNDPRFMKGTVSQRQLRLKEELRLVRQTVSKYMKDAAGQTAIESLRRNAHMAGSAGSRQAAKKMLSERGIQAPINDLGYRELQMYMEFIVAYE